MPNLTPEHHTLRNLVEEMSPDFEGTILSPIDEHPSRILPAYGFGTETNFHFLAKNNPYLFRVHTPRRSAEDDQPPASSSSSSLSFLAPAFDGRYTETPLSIPSEDTALLSTRGTYRDAAVHLEWTTRTSSEYVSASFSFAWAIWEALRRYQSQVKHDVEIAIIDALALSEMDVDEMGYSRKGFTVVELLEKARNGERSPCYGQWYRSSQDSQAVLIHACIPSSAVLASVPLLTILSHLPSYFYLLRSPWTAPSRSVSSSDCQSGSPRAASSKPSARRSWTIPDLMESLARSTPEKLGLGLGFGSRKPYKPTPSYRQFCIEMTSRYSQLSRIRRIRDASIGSVELAFAFLRTWVEVYVGEGSNPPPDSKCIPEERIAYAVRKVCDLARIISLWPDPNVGDENDDEVGWGIIEMVVQEIHGKAISGKAARDEMDHLKNVVQDMEGMVQVYERRLTQALGMDRDSRTESDASTTVESQSETAVHSRTVSLISEKAPLQLLVEQASFRDSTLFNTDEKPSTSGGMADLAPINGEESDGDEISSPSSYTTAKDDSEPSYRDSRFFLSLRKEAMEPVEEEDHEATIADGMPVHGPSAPHSVDLHVPDTISCLVTGFLLGALLALCIASSQRRAVLLSVT